MARTKRAREADTTPTQQGTPDTFSIFQTSPKEAAAVVKRLEDLREINNGRLTATAVVDDARHPASPLHRYFTWDNNEAAARWRLEQARKLIANVVVKLEGASGPTRAFVSVRVNGDEHRSFTRVDVAMRDVQLREQVLAEAKRELRVWRKKYEMCQELAELFAHVDEALGERELAAVPA